MTRPEIRNLLFFSLLVIGSRLPFIFDGYGSEEDAWALALTAERIGTTGIYEVSRLPGHPLQELIYSACWQGGAVSFNLLTVLLSTLGILAFVAMLQRFQVKHALMIGLALAFTPAVYINSTNDMDYTWAMAFILISGYFISKHQHLMAGLFLAFAVGCRITSGAMLLPYTFLIYQIAPPGKRFTSIAMYTVALITGSLLLFIPVIQQYGISFFTYYEHFPLPGLAKNIYKGSIAVWGLPSLLTILYLFINILSQKKPIQEIEYQGKNIFFVLLIFSGMVLLLYTIAFIKVPLKAAFMIPAIPFVLLALSLFIQKKQLIALTGSLVISCFFFGINLAEANRGSESSAVAFTFSWSRQQIAFDPLSGLLIADRSKRKKRAMYVHSVLRKSENIDTVSVIISGWWLSEILVRQKGYENKRVLFRHYLDEQELKWYKENGYALYYLEDQDEYNDLRYKKSFTSKYARPF